MTRLTGLGSPIVGGCALLASFFWTPSAAAQQTPPVLPTPEEVTPDIPDTAPPPRVDVDARGAFERQPCPFAQSPLTLSLETIRFTQPDGSPLAPEIALALQGINPAPGVRPLSTVCDIRDAANAALRDAGWVASVQIPPQEITGTELQLHVITARIVEMRVRGSVGPYDDLLRSRIAAIQALDPLNQRDAERLLLLSGDVPGLDVSLALSPAGTRPGEVIGEMTVSYHRFAILGNIQNYNSRLLGRETAYLRAEAYGLTGMGDVTYLGASSTLDFEEQMIVQAGHVMTLSTAGTTLGGRFTYAWSRPDLAPLDYRTDTLIAGFDVAHPLIRSVTTNLSLAGGFDYVDQTTDVISGNAALPLTGDKLRILFASLSGDMRGNIVGIRPAWTLRGRLELRKGLDIFDATQPGFSGGRLQSRIDGNSSAFVVRAEAEASVAIGPIFGLSAAGLVQWTDDPLLNYEEFSLGNLTIGRGYDPGSNSGDRAVGLRAEVHANLPITAPVGAQLFGFYDIVHLDNLDNGAIEVDRTLRSYGGGLRLTLPGQALLEVTYAKPIDRALSFDPGPPPDRVLVSLSFRFRDRSR